ncbi:MAG: magnesium transporter CorA family protein [Candidatus Omnitrophota bacterium]
MLKTYNLINQSLSENSEATGDAPVMVVFNPDENEKKYLIDHYQLDEHTLKSTLDPNEQGRLEFEPEHIAVILKNPKNYSYRDRLHFKVSSVGMFLFPNRLIIVSESEIPLFNGKPFAKINDIRDVFLKIIENFISHFLGHLNVIYQLSEELEQRINASMENKSLLNLFTLNKSLVYYLNAIHSNALVIEKLKIHAEKIAITGSDQELLDDLLIENNQCLRQAEIYSNVLSGLMDARASIVGNNLNTLMKTLNIITIGIMVPTFIVSLFSMNVTPIALQGHPYAFWLVIAISIVSVIGFMLFWKFKKWK